VRWRKGGVINNFFFVDEIFFSCKVEDGLFGRLTGGRRRHGCEVFFSDKANNGFLAKLAER